MISNGFVDAASIGLQSHQYQLIQEIVLDHALVDHAWVFGSRAMSTYKDSSDIDIAVEGDNITLGVVADMQDHFEQSSLPYKVDIVVMHKVTSKELLTHINTHGIKLK